MAGRWIERTLVLNAELFATDAFGRREITALSYMLVTQPGSNRYTQFNNHTDIPNEAKSVRKQIKNHLGKVLVGTGEGFNRDGRES